MKVDPDTLNANNLLYRDLLKNRIYISKDIKYTSDKIANNFSSLYYKSINYNIGLLQSVNLILDTIIYDNDINLSDIFTLLNNSSFMGKNIFTSNMIIKDNDELLFDANRILDIVPIDDKDIYIFKKHLKKEQKFLLSSLDKMKLKAGYDNDYKELNKDYLKNNSTLFSNSHDVSKLYSKIDTLLS